MKNLGVNISLVIILSSIVTMVPTALLAKNYAIIVGMAHYVGTSWLRYADDDAMDMRAALLAYSDWLDEDIILLINENGKKHDILNAFLYLETVVTEEDNFLFFFSGHGLTAPDMEPYDEADGYDEFIYPYDGRGVNTCIRDDELSYWVSLLRCRNKTVIIDSCFSGGMFPHSNGFGFDNQDGTIKSPPDAYYSDLAPSPGDGFAKDLVMRGYHHRQSASKDGEPSSLVVLMASREDEPSYEYSSLQNGLFTHFLTRGFLDLSCDENDDGGISPEEAFRYADYYVRYFYPGVQTPQMYDDYPFYSFNCAQDYFPGYNVSLWITADKEQYAKGELMNLNIGISNPSYATEMDLYIVLEVNGGYYFLSDQPSYPSFMLNPYFFPLPLGMLFGFDGGVLTLDLSGVEGTIFGRWYIAGLIQGKTIPYGLDYFDFRIN